MQRFIPSSKLYVGQLVVVTTNKDAQVRTIGAIHRSDHGTVSAVTLLWREGKRMCGQDSNPWTLYKPTLDQIEFSIEVNGALVNKTDICRHLIALAETA
jgi:hypothetical protein